MYLCPFSLLQREDAASEQRHQIVQKLLEKLPEIERTVVILHYLGEMTCEAISKFLGVSPNTVKSRLNRARKRLSKDDSILRETLSSVSLSPNLTQNILRKIRNIEQTPPSGSKPLLPLGALGSSIVLIVFLLGMSNQFLNRYHSLYSLDAQSETTIEIVEVPIITEIKSISAEQNRVGNDTSPGNSSNNGLQKGNKDMQNNFQQDSTKWKLPDGAKARLGKGYVFDMKYSPDGTLFAAAGTIGIWIYDAHTGKEIDLLTRNTYGISSIAFSPNNQLLASEGKENTILLWDLKNGEQIRTFSGHQDIVKSIAFSPDGKTIASGSCDETIRIWEVSTGKPRFTFAGHADEVSEVMYLQDGELLLSHGRSEGTIHLWNANTGEYIRNFSGHTGNLTSIASSPDGKTLASSSQDKTIQLLDINTRSHLKTLTGHEAGVTAVVYAFYGSGLASGSEDGTIRLWNIHTGDLLLPPIEGAGQVTSLASSPDSNMLASGSAEDNAVHIWDTKTGKRLHTFIGHTQRVNAVVFSPDGETLVSVSSDGTVLLWDLTKLVSSNR